MGNFAGVLIMSLFQTGNLKLYISLVCRQIRLKIDIITQKWELFRKKKKVSLKDFFQASPNPVYKKVYKTKV